MNTSISDLIRRTPGNLHDFELDRVVLDRRSAECRLELQLQIPDEARADGYFYEAHALIFTGVTAVRLDAPFMPDAEKAMVDIASVDLLSEREAEAAFGDQPAGAERIKIWLQSSRSTLYLVAHAVRLERHG